MFARIFVKEWREKALIAALGLGALVLLLLVRLALPQNRDLQDWLTYATLLVVFPFTALLLGSAGFETEFRNDAWAFLFSRPAGKIRLWLAKYVSLLALFSSLWLAFILMRLAVPGFPDTIGVALGMEISFPLLSLVISLSLLTIAFSLSMLSGRQISVLFAALIIGAGLTWLVYSGLSGSLGWDLVWTTPDRALQSLEVSQVLLAAAFAAGAILTLARTDFSQARRKAIGYAGRTAGFAVLALLGTVAWASFAPEGEGRYVEWFATLNGTPLFETLRGVFRYDGRNDGIRWLVKARQFQFFPATAAGGKVAYFAFDIRNRKAAREDLWLVDPDGRQREKVVTVDGRGPGLLSRAGFRSLSVSPDGRKIAVSIRRGSKESEDFESPLWVMNIDGTGAKSIGMNPAPFQGAFEKSFFWLIDWVEPRNGLLAQQRAGPSARLWLCDLASRKAKILFEAPLAGLPILSPDRSTVAIYLKNPDDHKPCVALVSLPDGDMTIADEDEGRQVVGLTWNKAGDKLAYLVRKADADRPGEKPVLKVYSLSEKRVIAERTLSGKSHAPYYGRAIWLDDDRLAESSLAAVGGLNVYSADLTQKTTYDFPPAAGFLAPVASVGNKILALNSDLYNLWRLDLKKGTWKRLY